ncbi:cytochrome P450 [Streptomyces phyllanthi]|uniref:Cytochrome P450 n=1 Tax=Streptomyces phyllanthi TaxID=1803180 RepID=A0A5N8VXM5_9ACTN|nr:cytochrome P450 [Streptomyces phyllanthi]MPY40021.1 cytochrome P450 [Streptomyces phyllanthi]
MDGTTTLRDPLDIMVQLLSYEGKQNPYPLYEEMRAHGPLVDVGGAHVFVTGHAECAKALREPALLLSTDDAVQDQRLPGWREHASWRWLTRNMLFSNDPRHERLRRFFGNAFSAQRVVALREMVDRLSTDAVEHLARAGADGGTVDLVGEFSYRYAIGVIGELLGVPPEDQPGMRADIGAITLALDPIGDLSVLVPGDQAMERFAEYFYALVARLRADPGPDMTSGWIRAMDDGGEITEEELVANLMLLLVAATEAPMDLISNTVRLAVEHPDHHDRLRTDPEFTAGFVDESFRFDPAVQALNRVASRDFEFFGLPVAQGTPLTLLIAAGNRDPRRFTDPGVFDPTRRDNQPLTLSAGSHYCLGAALARMSVESMLPRLFDRLPGLALAKGASFRDQIVQRGHERLPVTVK